MILVDTSVWIDHFRSSPTPEAACLTAAIQGGEEICTCGPVLTEVLQGIQDPAQNRRVRTLFDTLVYLPLARGAFLHAADLHRAARAKGMTIRSTIDCLIAACAIAHQVLLLHRDRDYTILARVSRLRVRATGERWPKGDQPGRNLPTFGSGIRTKTIPSLPDVLAKEGRPAPTPPGELPPGEKRILRRDRLAGFVREIQKPKKILLKPRHALREAAPPAGSEPDGTERNDPQPRSPSKERLTRT